MKEAIVRPVCFEDVKVRDFTYNELNKIEFRAEVLAANPKMNPTFSRAYLRLTDAAANLAGLLSRVGETNGRKRQER